jgi:hypothetical protein
LGLVTGQCNVFAQLFEELALRAAKGLLGTAGTHQHAKDLALHAQGCDHQGSKPCNCQSLGEGIGHLQHIGFVHELAADAPGESILINRDIQAFWQIELPGIRCATHAQRTDGQRLGHRIV